MSIHRSSSEKRTHMSLWHCTIQFPDDVCFREGDCVSKLGHYHEKPILDLPLHIIHEELYLIQCHFGFRCNFESKTFIIFKGIGILLARFCVQSRLQHKKIFIIWKRAYGRTLFIACGRAPFQVIPSTSYKTAASFFLSGLKVPC